MMLNTDERNAINEAVATAERRTSAEIVPALVRSSGRYDRAEDLVGLVFAVVAMIAVAAIRPAPLAEPGDWSAPGPGVSLAWTLVTMLGAWLVGSRLAMWVPGLRRVFVPRAQMAEEVAARAALLFLDHRIHHTDRSAGVLIFVSVFERSVVVLADAAAFEALGQELIDDLCADCTRAMREKRLPVALVACVEQVGAALAEALPQGDAEDVNAIADAVIVEA